MLPGSALAAQPAQERTLARPPRGWPGQRKRADRVPWPATLAAQPIPTARNLYGIGCVGPAACYAVGDNDTILALQ